MSRSPAQPKEETTQPAGSVTRLDAAGRRREARPAPGSWVGECLEVADTGRVRVRRRLPDGAPEERWIPTLLGLAVREADRLLVQELADGNEPVAVGVIDGFARRPDVARRTGARLALAADESLRVAAANGAPLLEVFQTRDGPTVRLLDADVRLELPGRLDLRAKSLSLRASEGSVRIDANDDVVVRGETVKLN